MRGLFVSLGLLVVFAVSAYLGYVGGTRLRDAAPIRRPAAAPQPGSSQRFSPAPQPGQTPAAVARPARPSPAPAQGPAAQPGGSSAPEPKPSPAPAYGVQVGAFALRENADTLAARLSEDGFTPAITAGRIFRVTVGRFAARADADRLVARLRARGYQAFVVLVEPAP